MLLVNLVTLQASIVSVSTQAGAGQAQQDRADRERQRPARLGAAGSTGPAAEVAVALRDVQRAGVETRRALARRLNMGVSDVAAMDQVIFATEPVGPVELGNRLGMRSASATALVDRLERAGHLRRVPHPSDRRRQTLAPTEHAISEVATALRPLIDAVSAAAAELTPDQAAVVTQFLRTVSRIMHDFAAEPADGGHGPPRQPDVNHMA
jgi:DNA-binding MarR family transcriptional regulator